MYLRSKKMDTLFDSNQKIKKSEMKRRASADNYDKDYCLKIIIQKELLNS